MLYLITVQVKTLMTPAFFLITRPKQCDWYSVRLPVFCCLRPSTVAHTDSWSTCWMTTSMAALSSHCLLRNGTGGRELRHCSSARPFPPVHHTGETHLTSHHQPSYMFIVQVTVRVNVEDELISVTFCCWVICDQSLCVQFSVNALPFGFGVCWLILVCF